MNRITLFFILLLPQFGSAATGPKLISDEPVYSFGHVAQTAVITNLFTVRNTGNTTFVVSRIRTTCSCTHASINKQMIGPGETAQVTVVFTAARQARLQKKKIILLGADSTTPALQFFMEGFVEPSADSQ